MRLVYIAGALRDPNAPAELTPVRVANIAAALAMRDLVAAAGDFPVVVHLLVGTCVAMDDAAGRSAALRLLEGCDEVRLVEGWEGSGGTWVELQRAAELGIPVRMPDGQALRQILFESVGERSVILDAGLVFLERSAA